MIQVAAAIIKKENKVFIARRSQNDSLSGKWEFPGGKVESGESLEECLCREMYEEFNLVVQVKGYFGNNYFDHNGVNMELLGFITEILDGEESLCLNVHDEIQWAEIQKLQSYDFAPADIPLVQKLMKNDTHINY